MTSLSKLFSAPYLTRLPAGFLDISDHSIKYMSIRVLDGQKLPEILEKRVIKGGIINEGDINDIDKLAEEISYFKKLDKKRNFVDASLPEELAYVFDIAVKSSVSDVREYIEFKLSEHVPSDPKILSFDFNLIKQIENLNFYSVVAYPQEIINEYLESVERSGFTLRSLEPEIVSMSRAVTKSDDNVYIVMDFGNSKITLAFLVNHNPVFSTTFKIDAKSLFKKIADETMEEEEELELWKFEEGIANKDVDILDEAFKEIVQNIKRYILFWEKEKKDLYGPVKEIVLCGGNASIRGLDAYLTHATKTNVKQGDVWSALFDINKAQPPTDKRRSFMYATVAGLAAKDNLSLC